MTDPAIDIDAVSVAFGGVDVLESVSTTVDEGRLVGLVGPNGAGKTTLLRVVNGVLTPDSGTVQVSGRRLDRLDSRATSRLVATVPQSTASTFAFDVRRIVAMGRTPHVDRFEGRTAADRRAVDDAMERASVAHLADRPVTEVSGGERQRVFLARALAQDTPVLLLDEPTSDLDVNHQVRTLELVRELVDEGRTVVAAIHDLDLAARYCDELRLLYDGRVQAAGAPDAVLTDTAVEAAFDTNATVARHPVTGSASVTAFTGDGDASGRVHVVGGGGSATPLLHRLAAAGFDLSVGAVGTADPDAETARALDGDLVTVPPYAPVDAETADAVAERIRRADAVVVADVPLATGNLPTLTAVADAATPTVVVDGRPLAERNTAGAAGERVHAALRTRGTVVGSADVVDAVRRAVARAEDAPDDADPRPPTVDDPRP
ncbi:ATP-binding cassette domain-containing protein [Haloplanus halobius]|uniref:ATP-binding cassette domain-containing protein n=1 Tax=Haloplanus halobius TaxID=2934938 RepID=UPI00200C166D